MSTYRTGRELHVMITVRARPAPDLQVAAEVTRLLERRAALPHPPVSMTVSDSVALGIAGLFRSPSLTGQVLDRFHGGGTVRSGELVEAARFEQGFASPEGHAALRCLILWVQGRLDQEERRRAPSQR
ncbi:hypothetical protein ACI784_04025 [Geodermatophilus sp. SYSU D01186]